MTNPPTSDAAGAVFPAWYVVSCIGGATLCAGEEDARRNVIEYARDYPAFAPYVAVQLAPVSTPQPPPEAGSVGVPEGWQLVPKEPTEAMMAAAWNHTPLEMDDMTDGYFGQAYRDMLAAAPAPKETP